MALHHFKIQQHDAEPTPYFTLRDERCRFTWFIRLYLEENEDGTPSTDQNLSATFSIMLDTPDEIGDGFVGGDWNIHRDGPITLDSYGNWWFQWHGHPVHETRGTFRDILDSLGFDLWRTDTPYYAMPHGFVTLSVDHLHDTGGLSRASQHDNVNRALHAVPRDIRIDENGINPRCTAWTYAKTIEIAAERAYGCAGLIGEPDYQDTPHSYVEVVGEYMRVEWFRPHDPHEVYVYFRLPPLARLFADKAEARVSAFTFRPLQLDPTFAPAEFTGCPDERDRAMEIANEARVHQNGPREFVAVAPWGAGALEGHGHDGQAARNHVYRKAVHELRDGDPEAEIA